MLTFLMCTILVVFGIYVIVAHVLYFLENKTMAGASVLEMYWILMASGFLTACYMIEGYGQ